MTPSSAPAEGDADHGLLGLQVEALVFASPRGMSEAEVGRAVDLSPEEAEAILRGVAARTEGRAVRLVRRLDGWSFVLSGDAPVPEPYHRDVGRRRQMSEAELATLAVIAMREPVTVPEIEAVRRVALSRGVVDGLVNRNLISPALRRTDVGRAVAYETTEAFLDMFGLGSVSDMPTPEEALALELDV